MWRMGLDYVAAGDRSCAERLMLVQGEPGSTSPAASRDAQLNHRQETLLALAKTGDTEMIELVRRFSVRLNVVLTPREIEIYARYVLAPGAQAASAPTAAAEQAAWSKSRSTTWRPH